MIVNNEHRITGMLKEKENISKIITELKIEKKAIKSSLHSNKCIELKKHNFLVMYIIIYIF